MNRKTLRILILYRLCPSFHFSYKSLHHLNYFSIFSNSPAIHHSQSLRRKCRLLVTKANSVSANSVFSLLLSPLNLFFLHFISSFSTQSLLYIYHIQDSLPSSLLPAKPWPMTSIISQHSIISSSLLDHQWPPQFPDPRTWSQCSVFFNVHSIWRRWSAPYPGHCNSRCIPFIDLLLSLWMTVSPPGTSHMDVYSSYRFSLLQFQLSLLLYSFQNTISNPRFSWKL